MSSLTIEERVAALERKLAQLQDVSGPSVETKDWRSTIGMFADDPVMKEIDEEGRRTRERDRRDAGEHLPREDS